LLLWAGEEEEVVLPAVATLLTVLALPTTALPAGQ
jgi:hypothetical protein